MDIKLFGKSIFSYRSAKQDALWGTINETIKESKYLQDFIEGTSSDERSILTSWAISENVNGGAVVVPVEKKAEEKKPDPVTPKGVYELKLLNADATFKVNTDPKYIDEQITNFKDKLVLLTSEEYDMRRGTKEISSILMRMENRKKYGKFEKFFAEFPYTTTTKINEVVKNHDNLKLGQVAQFVADMPKEAIKTMKDYDKTCLELCEKKAVFYIIADKKDFKKNNVRRDPILLAQSPYGHFWQILGAWDAEMLFLEEL